MMISFITTVFNEEKTIEKFLNSLLSQSLLPQEIVIVDGGSTDATVQKVKIYELPFKKKKVTFKVLIKKGNRSIGRNEAIRNATGNIITCSDSGNILDKDWVKNITKSFRNKKVDVVAGYYKGKPRNIFQKCLIPYVFVMPDKVDPEEFLPATRSVAFTKAIWKKAGKFDEQLSHNEDYVFANRLRFIKAKIVFAKDAIVYWLPRTTSKEAFIMFFRFALGDAEAGILRTNVILLFARYFLGLYFVFLGLLYKSIFPITIILIGIIAYIFWSIKKNYHYVQNKKAIKILPLLQFTADAAVISGTVIGFGKRLTQFNYLSYLNSNKFLFFVILSYLFITILTIRWGIPNQNHPFPYHMDEWHQLQSIANTFRYGTPNTEGSANGTMFHFIITGFYLIPFMITKFINPFALTITNSLMRERVFEVLRLNTILWGALSIIIIARIARLLKISQKLTIVLFTFTPLWIMLSGYFKYDIALLFWILLSLLFFLRFAQDRTNKNYLLAAIPSGLAVAVKISAIPLILVYILSYIMFQHKKNWNYRYFITGITLFIIIVLLFGMPDTLFGKGNILDYLYNNLFQTPASTENLILGMNSYEFLFFKHYPLVFGYSLITLFLSSIFIMVIYLIKDGIHKFYTQYKISIFLFLSLIIFVISLLSLKIFAAGNRSLVLLPFLVLISSHLFSRLLHQPKVKNFVLTILFLLLSIQLFQCFSWISVRTAMSPQQTSSIWIQRHIPLNQTIGLEDIPIYQYVPDIIQKEFYFHQYGIINNNRYRYEIINAKSKKLPNVIVITNDTMEQKLLKKSVKNDLRERLQREHYKKVATFLPDVMYYEIFGNEKDFYLSGLLVASPVTISIYNK